MLTIEIDDSQLQHFIKTSPKRADWAMREALLAMGGHLRNKMIDYIEKGGEGWPPLIWHPEDKPLQALASLVRYTVSRSTKTNRLTMQVGFFWGKASKMSSTTYKGFKRRFKSKFGMTPAALAKIHEYGKRVRITPGMRRYMAAHGNPLKATTTHRTIPARPIIAPVFRKNKAKIPGYIEKKFFANFFSKKNPRLGV